MRVDFSLEDRTPSGPTLFAQCMKLLLFPHPLPPRKLVPLDAVKIFSPFTIFFNIINAIKDPS